MREEASFWVRSRAWTLCRAGGAGVMVRRMPCGHPTWLGSSFFWGKIMELLGDFPAVFH